MSISKSGYAFIVILLVTFAVSLINTSVGIRNQKLSADIDLFTEEKMLLRAKYFSNISAHTLTFRAGEMSMVQPEDINVKRVLAPKHSDIFAPLRNAVGGLFTQINVAMRTPQDIISGY